MSKWTDEKIEESIRDVMTTLNIDYMPSRADVIQVVGNESLYKAIHKTGGIKGWADKLNISFKDFKTIWTDKKIEDGIKEVMNTLNIERMPTRVEMSQFTGSNSLYNAIHKTGGIEGWANKLSLPTKSSLIRWTDERIENAIKDIMNTLHIEYMPSVSEISQVVDDCSLRSIIIRTGGFRYWADKLNIPLKDSETKLGNDFEFVVKDMLESQGYSVEKMSTCYPYDLFVNNCVKVDVKSSHYTNENKFCFKLNKLYPTCDIYVCVGLNDDTDVDRLFIIPSNLAVNKKTITCGKKSKYDVYIDRWDYIQKYCDFNKSILDEKGE